jgi:predicted unusual protein kinase regulating ubiquinone biosynthesis (AarF/ABC1/UbiB family)
MLAVPKSEAVNSHAINSRNIAARTGHLRWQRSQSLGARQWEICRTGARFASMLWWDQLWQRQSTVTRQQRADWLVQSLLDLGPTFIKIGQFLSTRVDLLPKEYVETLSSLHDAVPQFDSRQAIDIIESELGRPLHVLYREFDPQPIAAASLGQVHRAKLPSGEQVVVKVQRPGLGKLLDLDYRAAGRLLRMGRRLLPRDRYQELMGIYEEFFGILLREIDYLCEGQNADRFRHNFANQPQIIVPRVYWDYSSPKVLTLSYVPGIKVDQRSTLEAAGLDPKRINQVGICCYLKQLLQDGFFHADPHPGNLAVTLTGELVFYDYGMMAEVPALSKDQMVKAFFAVMKKDTDQVLQTLQMMGMLDDMADITPMRRVMQMVLEEFTEKPLDVKAFARIKQDVYAVFEQQPFRLPSQMTYVLKSLTTLDGIARILDPDYNLNAAAQPFVKSLVGQDKVKTLGSLARQAKEFVSYKLTQPSSSERAMKRLEERIERGELQLQVRASESERILRRIQIAVKCLVYACLTGSGFVAGAVLITTTYQGLAIASFTIAALFSLGLLRGLIQLALRERLDRLAEKK